MNNENLFIILLAVVLSLALLFTALGLTMIGYAIKGWLTGTGAKHEIKMILEDF